ncbi:MAG: hypothetical protein ABI172_05255 [Ginsengibacter sp.]
MITFLSLKSSFKKSINNSLVGSLEKRCLKPKSVSGSIKVPILGFGGGGFSLRIEKQIVVVQRWDTVLSYMLQKKIWY